MRQLLILSWLSIAFLALLSLSSFSQDKRATTYITLNNGSSLVGWLMSQTTDSVQLKTRHGEYRIARSDIKSMETEGEVNKTPPLSPLKIENPKMDVPPTVPTVEVAKPNSISAMSETTQAASPGNQVRISLKGKRVIIGTIVSESDDEIRVQDNAGTSYLIPKSQIANQEPYLLQTGEKGPAKQIHVATGYPVDKGSLQFGASLGFTSDTDEKIKDPLNTLSLGLNGYVFFVRGVAVGFDIAYASLSIGDESISSTAVGPSLMFALGSATSSVFTYCRLGYNYVSMSLDERRSTITESGSAFKVGLGFLFWQGRQFGVPLEFGVSFQSFDKVSVTTYSASIGLTGLLFKLF